MNFIEEDEAKASYHLEAVFVHIYCFINIWLLQDLVVAYGIFSYGMQTLSCGTWDIVS